MKLKSLSPVALSRFGYKCYINFCVVLLHLQQFLLLRSLLRPKSLLAQATQKSIPYLVNKKSSYAVKSSLVIITQPETARFIFEFNATIYVIEK